MSTAIISSHAYGNNAIISQSNNQIKQNKEKDANIFIPDIIEETIIDSEGRSIMQKFEKGKLLGKGGFGRCYVGTLMSNRHVYALKIVPKSSLSKKKAKQKLQSEIRIHRTLKHFHVVKFERFFEDIHNVYIVLELCHNNSMSEMLKRRKKLSEPEVRYYLQQLVLSLQYLHRQLVIHRDLKLGNLFLDSNMRVKVGDFGLAAKLTYPEERKKTVCGTPNYLAPEILEGKDGHSFEVDIWSTGIVMYTLLVGKPPFEDKDMKTTYTRILSNSYTFPDHTFVSEDAKSLIRNILQHRPERRPSLDDILSHRFFSSPTAFLPHSLPENALREIPSFDNPKVMSSKIQVERSSSQLNDENDPGVINRTTKVTSITEKPSSSSTITSSLAGLAKRVGNMTISSNTERPKTTSSSFAPLKTQETNSSMKARLPIKKEAFEVHVDNTSENIKSSSASNRYAKPVENMTLRSKSSIPTHPIKASSLPTSTPKVSSHQSQTNTNTNPINDVTTPPNQIVTQNRELKGTLEEMHEMLDHSYINNNDHPNFQPPPSLTTNEILVDDILPIPMNTNIDLIAKNWVVRYVDYTSKYGLGFLLNTGSTGVYFNDSTKIILSSNGNVFQYIERRKRDNNSSPLTSKNEHIIQSHLITCYPIELQKKVTLLRHFRNYLIEQHKLYENTISIQKNNINISNDDIHDYNSFPPPQELEVKSIPMLPENVTQNGSNANIQFGQSSVKCISSNETKDGYDAIPISLIASTNNDIHGINELESLEMPYVKKWVRTRHAILFRLSNRTVQVIFFDKSEILLSSEAHIVTYVNKQLIRSEHSLDEVMQLGRTDIAKRLRYTKDIMYRLINLQQR